ncbi:MAG: hypothetical protein Q4F81_08230 [Eubacteriales bacterium]|nr:hypothetical protein [Eubacteriales bacterium]
MSNKFLCLLCAGAVSLTLFGCGKKQAVIDTTEVITLPTAPVETEATIAPDKEAESLTVVLAAGEIYTLNQYPNLKSVDLSGSTCYATILEYIQEHPKVDVTYTVDLGGTSVSNKATSVVLEPGSFSYDSLLENLQYLPNLTTISLPSVNLTPEQIDGILAAYPELTLDYSVSLFGQDVALTTTELDLTAMSDDQVDEACEKLGMLTALTNVNLSSGLSMDSVARLQNAAPHVTFHYSFTLFGKTVNTADEEIIYKNQSIGNAGEADLRKALTILDNCSRFVLDNCGFDYEILAQVREDFRDGPKVVWRVYFGVDNRYNLLTDEDTLRAVYNVTDSTCGPMKYCEGVKYMDIGHNEYLTDLSFVSGMPELEVMIASGCAVTELVGFENCKKLTWLELAYCYKLKDIDCLSECESLTYLNLSYTSVSSFMPLDGAPLKRFVCLSPKASTAEQNTFVSIHPKDTCISVFYGYSNPYGYGWRYDDNGKTFNEYYKNVVRVAFNYDELEKYLPKD